MKIYPFFTLLLLECQPHIKTATPASTSYHTEASAKQFLQLTVRMYVNSKGEIEKAISPNDKSTDGSLLNLQVGSGKNNKSLYTKITTKNTTESECTPAQTSGLVKSSNDKQASDSKQSKLIKPDDISEQVWQDLLKFRKQKTRSDMTVTAWNRNFKQLLIA